jgi:DNA primase
VTPSIAALLQSRGIDAEPAEGWVRTECPWHKDDNPSASFNESAGRFTCHACSLSGTAEQVLVEAEGLTPEQAAAEVAELPPATIRPEGSPTPLIRRASGPLGIAASCYHHDVEGAASFLKNRGIGRLAAGAAMLGYVDTPLPGHELYRGRLAIPYLTPAGVVDIRFRAITGDGPKYLSLPGVRPGLYQASVTLEAGSCIAVCEGELDALILYRTCGIPAVGVPGASAWRPVFERVLDGFERVLVIGDGDTAGRRFAARVSAALPGGVAVRVPEGMDVNDLYCAGGREGVMDFIAPHLDGWVEDGASPAPVLRR